MPLVLTRIPVILLMEVSVFGPGPFRFTAMGLAIRDLTRSRFVAKDLARDVSWVFGLLDTSFQLCVQVAYLSLQVFEQLENPIIVRNVFVGLCPHRDVSDWFFFFGL